MFADTCLSFSGQHYQFTCQQLLKLGKLLDFTDTSSRKIAGVLLQNLLLGGIYSPENEEHVGDGGIAGDKEWEEAIVDFGKSVHAAPGEWITVMIELVEKLGRPCREGGAYPLQWLKCLNMAGLLLQDMDSACQLVGSVIEPTELVDALLLSAVRSSPSHSVSSSFRVSTTLNSGFNMMFSGR